MKVELVDYEDNWQKVKDRAMQTIGKNSGKYPDHEWKKKILKAEHSPIRLLMFTIKFTDIPYWVVNHFTRHWVGVEHFVSTQRTDRTGVPRDELPQNNPVGYTMVASAQALINISRKRLCNCASSETRKTWQMVKNEIAKIEPELAECMVKECVYRGHCPEMYGCSYAESPAFQKEIEEYRK